jgi:hypothetical protein
MRIPSSHRKKLLQYFFGKINFVIRFDPDFAKISKPLQRMIKKDVQFKWASVEKEAFEYIKEAIVTAPYLRIPHFTNELLLYTFVFDHSLAVILT